MIEHNSTKLETEKVLKALEEWILPSNIVEIWIDKAPEGNFYEVNTLTVLGSNYRDFVTEDYELL